RTVWVVPVVLGDGLPRCDSGDLQRESWARTVLILFVPWRRPGDLKAPSESWYAAYERRRPGICSEHAAFIRNMNVLSECRDARSEH
ncbi:uncharacterized protein TRAVEDRAFT_95289, partial [Trametes versicolor FP-101664 SS1]